MTERKFCILVNPVAGKGQALKVLKRIQPTLKTLPIKFRIVITDTVDHAQKIAKEAVKHGEYIAVIGGDGTARAVAEVLVNKGVLAFIPAGRGNDIARTLNLPLDPIAACKLLAYGQETVIDVAKVNDRVFLSICSLGFDSIANQIANRTHIGGACVYLYAGLRALCTWKPIHFKVTIDDKTFEHTGYTVAVANACTYGGGMQLAPYASVKDGLLDVVLIGAISKFRVLMNVPRVFKGTHIHEPGFKLMRGQHIKIEADSQYGIYADGDFISDPPATIDIFAQTLRVLVP